MAPVLSNWFSGADFVVVAHISSCFRGGSRIPLGYLGMKRNPCTHGGSLGQVEVQFYQKTSAIQHGYFKIDIFSKQETFSTVYLKTRARQYAEEWYVVLRSLM